MRGVLGGVLLAVMGALGVSGVARAAGSAPTLTIGAVPGEGLVAERG